MTRVFGAVLLTVVAAFGIAACGSSGNGGSSSPTTLAPVDARGKKTVSVDAHNNAFSPPTIIVSPGTTVTWTNTDQVAHDVKKQSDTADFGGKFGVSVGDFGPGQTYSFTFTKPGSYPYFCSIHSLMTGTVQVEALTGQ